MISIQSISTDRSTDDVIHWLHYLNNDVSVNLFSDESNLTGVKIELSNENGLVVSLNNNKIDNFWYRRGEFVTKNNSNTKINRIIDLENKITLLNFLHKNIYQNNINSYSDNNKYKTETPLPHESFRVVVCYKS